MLNTVVDEMFKIQTPLGHFFVSWFLATPNISQVVYLAIYQWTTGGI